MELPGFIDEDIIYSFGYWLLTLGAWIAFLFGFKLAENGLFGIAAGEEVYSIGLLTKIFILLLTPVASYMVSLKFFR